MKKAFKILSIYFLFTLSTLLIGCTVTNPEDSTTGMDPNMKIFLIIICSIFLAGMIGYGIYFYIKQRKDKKKDIEE